MRLPLFEAVTSFIESLIRSLNIGPTSYAFIFPPSMEMSKVLEMVDDGLFPTADRLAPAFTYCIYLGIARYVLHYTVFKPLAEYSMQVKEVPIVRITDIDRSLPPNKNAIEASTIAKYCEQSGRKEYDVKKYLWQRRRNEITHRKIVKYVEALWRCIFYSSFCVLGFYTLFVPDTAIWITSTKHHFEDWPLHPMSDATLFYYYIELGCYFHQLMWTEVSRSDALEMIVHHIVTISLILVSFLANWTRIGASILLLHDTADVFLESAKVMNYTSKGKGHSFLGLPRDVLFGLFTLVFFYTRLYLFPRYILYSVFVEGIEQFGCGWFGCYMFMFLFGSLQLLHIFWFYLIMRMVYKLVFSGGIEKDERSDDDEELEEFKDDNEVTVVDSTTASTATGTDSVRCSSSPNSYNLRKRK